MRKTVIGTIGMPGGCLTIGPPHVSTWSSATQHSLAWAEGPSRPSGSWEIHVGRSAEGKQLWGRGRNLLTCPGAQRFWPVVCFLAAPQEGGGACNLFTTEPFSIHSRPAFSRHDLFTNILARYGGVLFYECFGVCAFRFCLLNILCGLLNTAPVLVNLFSARN